jgi:hypothetical protein
MSYPQMVTDVKQPPPLAIDAIAIAKVSRTGIAFNGLYKVFGYDTFNESYMPCPRC